MRVLKWLLGGVLGLAAILVVAVFLIAYSQDGSIKVLQSFLYWQWDAEPNSFQPRTAPIDRVLSDGVRVKTNLAYGDRYPNSYLDIWYPTADLGVTRPTVIFIHGADGSRAASSSAIRWRAAALRAWTGLSHP
jgi:hypothetical protein